MRISDWSSDVCSSDLVEFVALRRHRMFRSVLRRGALTAENRHAWRVDRDRGEDDLLARDAGTEEAADVHVVAERDARSDGLEAGDENAFVGLVDNAKIGGLRLDQKGVV